jgi:hypothetical protein
MRQRHSFAATIATDSQPVLRCILLSGAGLPQRSVKAAHGLPERSPGAVLPVKWTPSGRGIPPDTAAQPQCPAVVPRSSATGSDEEISSDRRVPRRAAHVHHHALPEAVPH